MRKTGLLLYLCAVCFSLTGCFPEAGDSLFAVPKLPGDYLALQHQFDQLIENGAAHAAPAHGNNRHSIQLVDFDGDGVEEVISFFRNAPDSTQFTVYLHRKIGGEYKMAGTLSGYGMGIDSVHYARRLQNGALAAVVCWDMGEGINGSVSVGILEDGTFSEALVTEYTEIYINDLTLDGISEILVTLQNSTARYLSRLYGFEDDAMTVLSEVPLSAGIRGISAIRDGETSDGKRAVFVDGISAGKGMLTDILMISNSRQMTNITLDSTSGISAGTYRPVSVNSLPVTGAETCAVPLAMPMPGYSEQGSETEWLLVWSVPDSTGGFSVVLKTYYNAAEDWYFIWPDAWTDRVTSKKLTGGSRTYTQFAAYQEEQEDMPLFSIYAMTGEDQEQFAAFPGFIRLGVTTTTTYYAIISDGDNAGMVVTEDNLRDGFRIIPNTWRSEGNAK